MGQLAVMTKRRMRMLRSADRMGSGADVSATVRYSDGVGIVV